MSRCLIFVFLALLSASVPTASAALTTVNITDGEHLKDYLCSSKNTMPAYTHLMIYPDEIKMNNLDSVECVIENTTDISITAWQDSGNDSSRIVTVSCGNQGGGFSFFNVTNLTIKSVYFKSCGTATFPNAAIKYVNGRDHFFFYNPLVKTTLFLNHCHNLTLYNVLGDSYYDIQGYQSSIIGVNLCGWSSITAVLSDADLPTDHHLLTLLIYYIDTAIMPSKSRPSLECNILVETNLLSGNKFVNIAQDLDGSPELMPVRPVGDFSLFLAQQEFNVNADITVLPMSPNSNNMLDCIKSSSCNSKVVILFVNSVTDSRVIFQGYPYQFCTDVSSLPVPYPNYRSIQLDVFFYETPLFSGSAMFSGGLDSPLVIRNTSFIGFYGGLGNGMPNGGDNLLRILDFSRKLTHEVQIENVAWCKNTVRTIPNWNPSKLSRLLYSRTIFQGTTFDFPMLNLKMSDLYVEHNTYSSNDQLRQLGTDSLMQFVNTEVTISGTSYFGHNSDGSVIGVVSSNLTLTGDLTVKGGFAFQGGGIQLDTNSYLFLKEPLVGEFINNSAQHGSAIYAPVHIETSGFSTDKTTSAIQILPNKVYSLDNVTDINVTLHFVPMSSSENSLYAPDFNFFGKQVFSKFLFHDDTWDSGNSQYAYTSLIDAVIDASDADKYTSLSNGVCFGIKGEDLDCFYSDNLYRSTVYICEGFEGATASVYPGQSAVSLICADNKEYQVSPQDARIDNYRISCETKSYGLLNVSYSGHSVSLSFGIPNFKQSSLNYCVSYSNMDFSRSVPFLNVNLLYPCPFGFDLAESSVCNTIDALRKLKYDANIEDLSFSSPPNSYTGYYSSGDQNTFYVNTNCPPGFCKNVSSVFSLEEFPSDFSCLHNRSGVLCGQCANQSVVFGSDTCFSCSNLYLLTLPMYALAGLLLVMVLFVLRLTVASGTINGVIFYANILSLSMDVLSNQNTEFHLEPLQIIISLLNLNFSFPLCLYNGMTTAAKALFQFVFPVYLWGIVLGLIIASRFSVRLSGIIAHCSIQVLSTLFFLSFSKLINTAVYVFSASSISTIKYTLNESYAFSDFTVWYYNGAHYGSGFHGFLLFLAAAFMLLFVLPYTVLLTFSYYFMRFKIVNKFKPFIDAYGGPFNDKWRLWFGLRLWISAILFAVNGALQGTDIDRMLLGHLVVILVFMLVQAHVRPFRNHLVGALDMFFMLNYWLIIMFYLLLDPSKPTFIRVYISLLSFAIIMMILVIIFHFFYHWIYLKNHEFFSKLEKSLPAKFKKYRADESEAEDSDQALFEAVEERDEDQVLDTY